MDGCMQGIIMIYDFPQIQGGPQISSKNAIHYTLRAVHQQNFPQHEPPRT